MLRFNGGLHGNYLGAWLFGAYYHDFEGSPEAELDANKFVFEPALRFAYRSVTAYAGISRIVDYGTFGDLTHLSGCNYFIRIGNYSFYLLLLNGKRHPGLDFVD
jgi:NTE family protein